MVTIYFQHQGLKIINDDVLTTTSIDNSSIDCIVTSPPYNVAIQYATHRDTLQYNEYLAFSRKWL